MDIHKVVNSGSPQLKGWWSQLLAECSADGWPVGRVIADNFSRDHMLEDSLLTAGGHPADSMTKALEAAARHYYENDHHFQDRGVRAPCRSLSSLSCHRRDEYKRFFCLGPAAKMDHAGGYWVSFFKVPALNPERTAFNPQLELRLRSTEALRASARESWFGLRSVLWFSPLDSVAELLGPNASLADFSGREIDAVRDRLGLAHFRSDLRGGRMELGAVVVACLPCCARVTVPTILDARGYEHFLPVGPPSNGQPIRWGMTAPLDGASQGFPEVVVWIDDEPHPDDPAPREYQSFWGQIALLTRAGGAPCTFFLVGGVNVAGYRTYRQQLLDEQNYGDRPHAS